MKAKSNHPEASLRNGNKPSGNILEAHGLHQGSNDTPAAESNVESLRHGKFSGKGMKVVQQVPENMAEMKSARAAHPGTKMK